MFEIIIAILNFLTMPVRKLWTFYRRPRLQVYFDPNESYHTRNVVNLGVRGFFCHVMVKNIGKEIALTCRGRLIKVEVPESGLLVGHADFQPSVTLKWGHEPDFDPRDIEPDIPRLLDVCCVFEPSPNILRFASDKSPCGIRTDFPRGNYVVTIRCDGKNLKPIDAQFVIRHQGAWNETKVEPFGKKRLRNAQSLAGRGASRPKQLKN